MYKLIAFDIDGTMLNTKYSIVKGLQTFINRKLGTNQPYEDFLFAFGQSGPVTMDHFGLEHECMDGWINEIEKLTYTNQPFDGIIPVLDQLTNAGIPLAVASARYRIELDSSLGRLDMMKYFDYFVCGDDVKKGKPDPETITILSEKSGVSIKDMLFIGDSQFDVGCAKNSGIDFALAGWGATEETKKTVSRVLSTPEEIIELAQV